MLYKEEPIHCPLCGQIMWTKVHDTEIEHDENMKLYGEEMRKDIPGYEGKYQASTLGNIRSLNYHQSGEVKNLSGYVQKTGYVMIWLRNKKMGRVYKLVHRVVAETFLPEVEGKKVVNHKNGIKTDNRLINLERNSYAENGRHSYKVLGHKKNSKEKNYDTARMIVQINKEGGVILRRRVSMKAAADFLRLPWAYNISKCCAWKIKSVAGYQRRYA